MSDSIAAIATRIQDRASTLQSEERVLELVQAEEGEQQALLDQALESCGVVRREYLQAIRTRHGLELELWMIEGQKSQSLEAIDELREETEELQTYKEKVQADWEHLVSDVMVHQTLKQEIYRHSIQAHIGKREKQMTKRQQQLMVVNDKTEALRADTGNLHVERERLEEELETLGNVEVKEDEDLSNLAVRVREMVAKVQ